MPRHSHRLPPRPGLGRTRPRIPASSRPLMCTRASARLSHDQVLRCVRKSPPPSPSQHSIRGPDARATARARPRGLRQSQTGRRHPVLARAAPPRLAAAPGGLEVDADAATGAAKSPRIEDGLEPRRCVGARETRPIGPVGPVKGVRGPNMRGAPRGRTGGRGTCPAACRRGRPRCARGLEEDAHAAVGPRRRVLEIRALMELLSE